VHLVGFIIRTWGILCVNKPDVTECFFLSQISITLFVDALLMAYFSITGSFSLRSGNKSIFIELNCAHLIMIEWCLFAMFQLQNLLIFLATTVDMLCDLHSKGETLFSYQEFFVSVYVRRA